MRCSAEQWQAFVNELGSIPYRFEFDAYAWADSIPSARLPENVVINIMPYLAEELELIRRLREGNYDACYLPLWREPSHRLFSRTSLSSKLTTYVAAGLPVIVDGPKESAAWELVSRYSAGVLMGEEWGGGEVGGRRGEGGQRTEAQGERELAADVTRMNADERGERRGEGRRGRGSPQGTAPPTLREEQGIAAGTAPPTLGRGKNG
jgi:hypothetical protein